MASSNKNKRGSLLGSPGKNAPNNDTNDEETTFALPLLRSVFKQSSKAQISPINQVMLTVPLLGQPHITSFTRGLWLFHTSQEIQGHYRGNSQYNELNAQYLLTPKVSQALVIQSPHNPEIPDLAPLFSSNNVVLYRPDQNPKSLARGKITEEDVVDEGILTMQNRSRLISSPPTFNRLGLNFKPLVSTFRPFHQKNETTTTTTAVSQSEQLANTTTTTTTPTTTIKYEDTQYVVLYHPPMGTCRTPGLNYSEILQEVVSDLHETQLLANLVVTNDLGDNPGLIYGPISLWNGGYTPFILITCDLSSQPSCGLLTTTIDQIRWARDHGFSSYNPETPIVILLYQSATHSKYSSEDSIRLIFDHYSLPHPIIRKFFGDGVAPWDIKDNDFTTLEAWGPYITSAMSTINFLNQLILDHIKSHIFSSKRNYIPIELANRHQALGPVPYPKPIPLNTIPKLPPYLLGRDVLCGPCHGVDIQRSKAKHTYLNALLIVPAETNLEKASLDPVETFFRRVTHGPSPHNILKDGADFASSTGSSAFVFNRGVLRSTSNGSRFELFRDDLQYPEFHTGLPQFRHLRPKKIEVGKVDEDLLENPNLFHPYSFVNYDEQQLISYVSEQETLPLEALPPTDELHATIRYFGFSGFQPWKNISPFLHNYYGTAFFAFFFDVGQVARTCCPGGQTIDGDAVASITTSITFVLSLFDLVGFQFCPVYLLFITPEEDNRTRTWQNERLFASPKFIERALFTRIRASPFAKNRTLDGGDTIINYAVIPTTSIGLAIRTLCERSLREHALLYLPDSYHVTEPFQFDERLPSDDTHNNDNDGNDNNANEVDEEESSPL